MHLLKTGFDSFTAYSDLRLRDQSSTFIVDIVGTCDVQRFEIEAVAQCLKEAAIEDCLVI